MKKQIQFFFYLLAVVAVQSCTKDRVPNPSTLNVNQTLIYDQNFDSTLTLPTGWVVAGGSGGWAISDSSDNSSYTPTNIPAGVTGGGYVGASGKNNLDISNPTSGGGTYTATTPAISTVGYTNIAMIWGARFSKNFNGGGSSISLAWSTDGTTWTNLPYQENSADSEWHLENNGGRISLPAGAANQTNLMFRWTAIIKAYTSGSYRIDDVQVYGTP